MNTRMNENTIRDKYIREKLLNNDLSDLIIFRYGYI